MIAGSKYCEISIPKCNIDLNILLFIGSVINTVATPYVIVVDDETDLVYLFREALNQIHGMRIINAKLLYKSFSRVHKRKSNS
jgi:hypothetical protein